MEENKGKKYSGVFSRKLRAGKWRTYFFDVRSTKFDDYYITITESKRRFDQGGYDSHKVFLYKEDFNKFLAALGETIDHVKNELMPDYNYEEFDRPAEDVTIAEDGSEEMPNDEKSDTIVTPPSNEVEETVTKPAKGATDEDALTWD